MLISHIVSIIIIVLDMILGAVIIFNGPRKKSNWAVFGIALGSTLWVFTNLMVDLANTNISAIRWSQATIIGPLFMPACFLYLSYVFPRDLKINKARLFLVLFPILTFLPFVFTKYNIESAQVMPGGIPDVTAGIMYTPFFIYFIGYSLWGIFRFLRKLKAYSRAEKIQVKYIVVSTIISFSIGVFTNLILLLMGISSVSSFGPLVTIIWVVGLSIAILRYHFFNIKVILAQILVFTIGVILLIQSLIAEKLQMRIFNGIIFLLFCFFGYLLTRSVLQEIKLREQLALANKELKKIDEVKTEFLSIASHQLRTPLTAIKGYLGMIDEGIYGKVSKEIDETLHKVYNSNERLIRLVNSLLDISRLEMGKMEFILEKVNIEEMTEDIVDELHISAKKKGLGLVFEHPEKPLPEITIDKEKIRQVILNLIDNAIKYTYKGDIIVRAKTIDHGKEKVIISVTDTGMGIARKEIKEIFKIYRRGTGVRLFPEGSGVGLYVARKLVEAHNGKVWAESHGKGKGSTFWIELPMKLKKTFQR